MARLALVLALLSLAGTSAHANSTRRVGEVGVSLTLPSGWHSWLPSTALRPSITDPLTRVVAVSAPFQFAATGCQVAAYAFPATAVAIVVLEWVRSVGPPMPSFPPRPSRFDAKALALHPAPAIECFDGPGGSTDFTDHGRSFGVYILAGQKATAATIARARAVLDTLRVQAR